MRLANQRWFIAAETVVLAFAPAKRACQVSCWEFQKWRRHWKMIYRSSVETWRYCLTEQCDSSFHDEAWWSRWETALIHAQTIHSLCGLIHVSRTYLTNKDGWVCRKEAQLVVNSKTVKDSIINFQSLMNFLHCSLRFLSSLLISIQKYFLAWPRTFWLTCQQQRSRCILPSKILSIALMRASSQSVTKTGEIGIFSASRSDWIYSITHLLRRLVGIIKDFDDEKNCDDEKSGAWLDQPAGASNFPIEPYSLAGQNI